MCLGGLAYFETVVIVISTADRAVVIGIASGYCGPALYSSNIALSLAAVLSHWLVSPVSLVVRK